LSNDPGGAAERHTVGRTKETMSNDPQKVRRQIVQEFAALAYERELARELDTVEIGFSRWRRNEVSAHELSELIHAFHDGAARRLYSVYHGELIEIAVGSAIARGVLTEEEVPSEILETLRSQIDFAREMGGEEEPSAEAPSSKPLKLTVGRGRPLAD
jgi:hypothetical protein